MYLTSPSFYRFYIVTDISGIINNTENSIQAPKNINGKIFSTKRK